MTSYCCDLRRKFLLGIVAEDKSIDMPVDAVDCIEFTEDGRTLLRIRFCPFCGSDQPGRRRVPPAAKEF